MDWPTPTRLSNTVDGVLEWTVELRRTAATAVPTGVGCLLPGRLWRSPAALGALARIAGPMLHAGRLRLAGRVPSGQRFVANPRVLWAVDASNARVAGVDIGSPAPLAEQDRLGDFWLPQRGRFAIGEASFEVFDPARHRSPRPAVNAAGA